MNSGAQPDIQTGDIRRQRELISMCRQLGALLSAGTDILRSLLVARDHLEDPRIRTALEIAQNDMALGMTLAASFRRHPDLFSRFFVDMIRQGEGEGELADVLQTLADHLEKELRIATQFVIPNRAGIPSLVPRAETAIQSQPIWAFHLAVWIGCSLIVAAIVHPVDRWFVVGLAFVGWGIQELRRPFRRPREAPSDLEAYDGRDRPAPRLTGPSPSDSLAPSASAGRSDSARPSPPPPMNSAPRPKPGDRRQMPL